MIEQLQKNISHLLKRGIFTKQQIADVTGLGLVTVYDRINKGNWRVSELLTLQQAFDLNIIQITEKSQLFTLNAPKPKGYKIMIEIDPNNFNPENMKDLEAELLNRLTRDFEETMRQKEEKGRKGSRNGPGADGK